MAALLGFDVYSPSDIAERVSHVGVAKARLPIISLVMLGMLASAFIALGSLYYVIVVADPALPHALQRALGGTVFLARAPRRSGRGALHRQQPPRHGLHDLPLAAARPRARARRAHRMPTQCRRFGDDSGRRSP